MIKGFDGSKLTPKQKAAELIDSQIDQLLEGYWIEGESDYDHETHKEHGPTEREIELIRDQLEKYAQRIYKILGL